MVSTGSLWMASLSSCREPIECFGFARHFFSVQGGGNKRSNSRVARRRYPHSTDLPAQRSSDLDCFRREPTPRMYVHLATLVDCLVGALVKLAAVLWNRSSQVDRAKSPAQCIKNTQEPGTSPRQSHPECTYFVSP